MPLHAGFGFFWSTVIALTSRSARETGTEFVAASAETSTRPHTAPTSGEANEPAGSHRRARRSAAAGGQTIAATGCGACTR